MKISINKILSAAIVTIVMMVAFVLFISTRQTQRVHDTAALVSHTQLVLKHIRNLMVSVLDNETNSRGYVITGKDQFLEQLKQSEKDITNELALLKRLTADNPAQQALCDSLIIYSDKRIIFSKQTAILRLDKGLESASGLVLSGEGKFYTDKIRYMENQMLEVENALLKKRKNTNEESISQLQAILYTVLAAGFILSLGLLQWIRSESKKQKLNEQKFSALLDAAPDATVIVNETGIIKMINLQMENLFGYKRNELIGQLVEILIPQELRARHVHHRQGFIKEEGVRSIGAGMELKAVKKNGVSFPVEISLSNIKTSEGLLVSASIRDMTEKRKAEDSLNRLNKVLAFQNKEKEDRAAELIIANKELVFQNDEKENRAAELIIANKELAFQNGEKENRAAELTIANKELAFQNQEKESRSQELLIVNREIVDRTAQLESVNKELESFSYSVSHDLRAPLRIIDGFGQILKEDYSGKLDEEGRETINTIMGSARKMGQLIDDLLHFSKIARSDMKISEVNMNELVTEVLAELKNSRISIPVQLRLNNLRNAKGDNNLLKQVWMNLISNAIKYSGAKKDPIIEIGMVEKKDSPIYYVKDNGAGFDMQYADSLFGVFQRLHKEAEFTGTGVGLALVQRIIVRHGGSVWGEAKINEGATFYFTLPEHSKNHIDFLKN